MTKTTPQGDGHLSLTVDKTLSQGDGHLENTPIGIAKLIGRIEQAQAQDGFNRLSIMITLSKIQLAFRKNEPAILQYASSFPEFCANMGFNYSTIKEHLGNIHTFGKTFIEQADRLGLPLRDLRPLRKLYGDDRTKAIQAVLSSETSEDARDIIRSLAVQNVQFEEAGVLTKQSLLADKTNLENELALAQINLKQLNDRNLTLRNDLKEARRTPDPQVMTRTLQQINKNLDQMSRTLELIDTAEIHDDNVEAEKERMFSYITGIMKRLGTGQK